MSEKVDISIPLSVITDKLYKSLASSGEPNAALIAKKIIENLELTEMGLSHLLQAYLGVEEQTPWVVGDECMVDPSEIHGWTCDVPKMREKGMLHKGYIKGKIKEIDFRKKKAINFEFEGVYITSAKIEEIRTLTQTVKISKLKSDQDLVLVRPDMAELL